MASKKGTGVNIGSVSILVIFVLLCLTTFATLSLVSANADAKLSKNAKASLTAYYKADSAAEEILAKVDKCLKSASSDDEIKYFNDCKKSLDKIDLVTAQFLDSGFIVSYAVPIDDKSELQVEIDVLYPASQQGVDRYKLQKWQAVNTQEWSNDESINLWQGE